MLNNYEGYFLGVIRGSRKGVIPFFVRGILHVLSWFYQIAISCRNWAYDHGWFRRYFPPVPVVISIGNIVAGGTGKTPVTLMIAKAFYRKYPLAILSRGYRSPAEGESEPVTLCKGNGPEQPASYCGDEPYLLAQNLPKAFVFVGKNRHVASHMAARAGAELILLDDGMQHRRLARDFEVVVMDVQDPFGQGYFLPRGLLRESPHSLSRADVIICNNVTDLSAFYAVKEKIVSYSKAPVIATKPEVDTIWDEEGHILKSLKDRRVGLFCGIAQPDKFKGTLIDLGAHVMGTFAVADHDVAGEQDLESFSKTCRDRGAEFIVCTEKDWVKYDPAKKLSLPRLWVQMRLVILEGEPAWNMFITKVERILEGRKPI